jgi:hypothetical protein
MVVVLAGLTGSALAHRIRLSADMKQDLICVALLFAGVLISAIVGEAYVISHFGNPDTFLSAPEVLEPIWRQLGIPHRMLDVLVSQIGL